MTSAVKKEYIGAEIISSDQCDYKVIQPWAEAVGVSGLTGLNGLYSPSKWKEMEKVMTWMGGVSYNLASSFCDPAVLKVLKCWQTTADDPLCCPDYTLELGPFL